MDARGWGIAQHAPRPHVHPLPPQAEAMRRLIIAALRDPRNQRFAFLSESCAPLFPPAVVHAQLLADRLSRVSLCPQHRKAAERQAWRWGLAEAEAFP